MEGQAPTGENRRLKTISNSFPFPQNKIYCDDIQYLSSSTNIKTIETIYGKPYMLLSAISIQK